MEGIVLPLEIAALSAALCGIHALKRWLGAVPLYLVIGLLETFLFVSGKSSEPIRAPLVLADEPVRLSFTLFLALLLSSGVLVYVLEGTRAARRLIGALAILYLFHGVVDFIIHWHASHPPAGYPDQGETDLVWFSTTSRLASLVAMTVDFVVIITSYQFLLNRMPRVPFAVPLFVALVLAMLSDAVVYSLVRWQDLDPAKIPLIPKFAAGIAAGVPMALYLQWRLRGAGDEVRRGIVERRAFDLVDLRRQLGEAKRALAEQKAQYLYVKNTFSRYVPPDVVDAIVEDPTRLRLGGELRDVTVLFADIRGYSTISEAMEPTQIIDLLNTYFGRVSKLILDRRGMINEFEGDAVLAVFGAPLDLPDHATRALEAAVAMLREVEALNAEWERDGTARHWKDVGIDRFAIRIGVHTGPVVAGNIGGAERIKYAVIGDTVNTTSRVEGLNKTLSTSLLCTDATVEAADLARLGAEMEDQGSHPVKGRSEPVHVYSIGPARVSRGT